MNYDIVIFHGSDFQAVLNLCNHEKSIFLASDRKAPTFWPLRETKLPLSGTVEQKNSIQTMASKKESLRSHVIVSRGEAETFLILLALCRNILFIRYGHYSGVPYNFLTSKMYHFKKHFMRKNMFWIIKNPSRRQKCETRDVG